MENKLTVNQFLLAVLYILLPLVAYKVKLLFLPCLVLVFILLWKCSFESSYFLINSYIISSSFFGISMAGIKIFDIVLIGILIYMILNRKLDSLNQEYNILGIFFIYTIFIYIFINLTRIPNNSAGYIEIVRYTFAFLALILFSQRIFIFLENKKVIKSIDFISFILILQTIAMSICHNVFGDLEQFKSFFLTINIFNYDDSIASGMGAETEARVSAFFSDPNKLMVFFLSLLFIRKLLTKNMDINKYDFIYLFGALITGARTSVIVVIIYLIVSCIATYLKGAQILGYMLCLVFAILIYGFLSFNGLSVASLINDIMNKALVVFGRQRTLSIDSNISNDGRVVIWKQASLYIKQHIIFGNGLLSEKLLLPYPTHNTLVQVLLDTGIVGLVLYLLGIAKVLWQDKFSVYFLILIGIPSLFLDLANYNFIYFVLGLIICSHLKKEFYSIEDTNSRSTSE